MAFKKLVTGQNGNPERLIPLGMQPRLLFFTLLICVAFAGSPSEAWDDDAERFYKKRQQMVDSQIKKRGVSDLKVLRAMAAVKRHLFVPDYLQQQAYVDGPLPIGYGQTISQPYIVAYMTEILRVQPQHKVLEVGTGSGYQAAVLAK